MKQIANRFFYQLDYKNDPIPGTLARYNKKPVHGKWVEVVNNCCPNPNCEVCPEPDLTEGDTFGLRLWSNGYTEPIDVVSATNSFSVAGGSVTLYNGQTGSIVVFRLPKVNGIEAYEQIYFGQGMYNMAFLDYVEDPEDATKWLITIQVQFYPFTPSGFLNITTGYQVINALPIDDLFIKLDQTARLFNSTPVMLYADHSGTTFFIDFTDVPSTPYDVNFYWQGALVHTISNESSQNYSFGSGTITGTKFDKVRIVPTITP